MILICLQLLAKIQQMMHKKIKILFSKILMKCLQRWRLKVQQLKQTLATNSLSLKLFPNKNL